MSNKTTCSLTSLAHPLIVNPAEDVETVRRKSRCLPPFPAIDLNNWYGFHISRLHLVGFKVDERSHFGSQSWLTFLQSPDSWLVKLTLDHEFWHEKLRLTPFSRIRDHEGVILYLLVCDAFEEGQEKIEVPLDHEKSRNELEKQWKRVMSYTQASCLIEEVYAVRSSLLRAVEEGLIKSDWLLCRLIADYQAGYEKFIPGYKVVYNLFDFVAGKIGETAATAIIFSALETINPVKAFIEILCGEICPNDTHTPISDTSWIVSPEETEFIKNLSPEQAHLYFSKFLDELHPDDPAKIAKQGWILSQYIDHDNVAKIILGSPTTTLAAAFSEKVNMYPICKVDVTEEGVVFEKVEEGSPTNFAILLESILQQLIQGMGLVCPYWFWLKSPHTCCGGRNRAFLEKVWKHTKPDNCCPLWMRLGCLG